MRDCENGILGLNGLSEELLRITDRSAPLLLGLSAVQRWRGDARLGRRVAERQRGRRVKEGLVLFFDEFFYMGGDGGGKTAEIVTTFEDGDKTALAVFIGSGHEEAGQF